MSCPFPRISTKQVCHDLGGSGTRYWRRLAPRDIFRSEYINGVKEAGVKCVCWALFSSYSTGFQSRAVIPWYIY